MSSSLTQTKQYIHKVFSNDYNVVTVIEVPGGTADRVIQRMRTEITRLRNKIKANNEPVPTTKMLSEVVARNNENGMDVIHFRKVSGNQPPSVELGDLEKLLMGGEKAS